MFLLWYSHKFTIFQDLEKNSLDTCVIGIYICERRYGFGKTFYISSKLLMSFTDKLKTQLWHINFIQTYIL